MKIWKISSVLLGALMVVSTLSKNSSAQPAGGRPVIIANYCLHPLELAVKYRNTSNVWVTRAFNVSGRSNYSTGVRATNSKVDLYGESTDGSEITWNNVAAEMGIDGSGNYIVNVACETSSPAASESWCIGLREQWLFRRNRFGRDDASIRATFNEKFCHVWGLSIP